MSDVIESERPSDEFLRVDSFTFNFRKDQHEILELKGINVYEDRTIWCSHADNGEGWDVFINYQPEDDDNDGTIDPSNLNRSWAKKFKTEMQESYWEGVIPFNIGRNLTTSEVQNLVRYFKRQIQLGFLTQKRDRELGYGPEDLGREKWSNYWAGEGYSY